MNHASKNKVLTWLVVLLLVANAASITMFWMGKTKQTEQIKQTEQPKGKPQDFLVKELKLDANQQVQLEILAKEHREAVNELREKVKDAKEFFFNLLKRQNPSDSVKKTAAIAISSITEQIDLLTLNHFQKVRALCNADQQKKFDEIIQQVVDMMGQQRRPEGPPQDRQDDNRHPPPPGEQRGNKPPREE